MDGLFTSLDTAKFADAVGFKTAPNPMTWTMLHKICELAWQAGRESMRQEIIPLVYGMCESDNVAARTVEAIRKIEA